MTYTTIEGKLFAKMIEEDNKTLVGERQQVLNHLELIDSKICENLKVLEKLK